MFPVNQKSQYEFFVQSFMAPVCKPGSLRRSSTVYFEKSRLYILPGTTYREL